MWKEPHVYNPEPGGKKPGFTGRAQAQQRGLDLKTVITQNVQYSMCFSLDYVFFAENFENKV